MKHKKDIGKLIENTLQDSNFTPNNELWSKIDDSLDRNFKKKKLFLLYFSIASLGFIFVLFAVVNQKDNLTDKNNNNTLNVSDEITIQKKKSLQSNNISGNTFSKIDTLNKKGETIDTTNIVKANTSEKLKRDKKYSSETKVTSTYYYSNSKKEQIITQDSKVIDSILQPKDSVLINKKLIKLILNDSISGI